MCLRGSHGKKERSQLRFSCVFRCLNAVTLKDAYPIPQIDERLSKLGDAKFFTTLDLGHDESPTSSLSSFCTTAFEPLNSTTAFEPLNRSLETFLARLFRTNERCEKSRRVFKKPRCYKDESDGCIDTWIEVMKLHFEEEDLSERIECSALTSILEGTALNCVMAKKRYQRDTAEKIVEILLNCFGSGCKDTKQ